VVLYLLTVGMVNTSILHYSVESEQRPPNGEDCKCGLANGKASLNRISSGTDVEESKYPWHALLLTGTEKMLCGGAIINSKWILTSAKCVQRDVFTEIKNVDEVEVEIGNNSHSKQIPDYGFREIPYKVAEIIVGKDLGLVKLENPLDFAANPNIRPICLPENKDEQYIDADAIVNGWGVEYSLNHIIFNENLQEHAVQVISQEDCAEEDSPETSISPSMICTTAKSGVGCIIKGDNGRLLVTSNGGDGETAGQNYELIGVLLKYDPDHNGKTVYTRVTAELDWIKETTSSDGETCPRT